MPDRTRVDLSEMKRQLKDRHSDWNDDFIKAVVQKAEVDSVYPTYTTPELPYWGENGMVLIGDAAHALQPTSGQGTSQALESAQTFSLLLAQYLSRCGVSGTLSVEDAVRMSAKGLYDIRNERVTTIGKQAKKMASGKTDNGIVVEYMMYFFLWLMTNFEFVGECSPTGVPAIALITGTGKLVLGDVHGFLYGWDGHGEVKKYIDKYDQDKAE